MSSKDVRQSMVNFWNLSMKPIFKKDFEVFGGRGFCKVCRKICEIRQSLNKNVAVEEESVEKQFKRGDFSSKGAIPEWPGNLTEHLEGPFHKRNAELLEELSLDEKTFEKAAKVDNNNEKGNLSSRFFFFKFRHPNIRFFVGCKEPKTQI
jgi:hypothetical protein